MFALGTGSAIFWLCGFYPWAVGLFVLLVFTVLHRIGNREGIVTGTVVVFHLIGYQSASPAIILDEFKMLGIGLGTR
ncbi:hypothetical protein HQN90_09610 [Paenibacillus alba]|nr:hypothetical protein [Paenibacillus alba]